jgi:hypothetical protein
VNKEPVFTNFKPESKEYRNKLAEIIRSNQDDLTYVFERYIQKNGSDYLEIKVYGDDIAATAMVLVEQKGNSVDDSSIRANCAVLRLNHKIKVLVSNPPYI